MLNKILENQAEQIAVNPSQAAFSLANNSKFPTPLEALEATTDTNITNNAINHSLTNNPSWQNYISDPLRFQKPENKIYFGIEALMDDARHYSIADKYGNELTDRARIIFDYAQPDDWWTRTRMGVKYWGVENKLQKARADLSGAIRSDDSSQEEIQSIKDRIQELEFDQQNNAVPFESELANTITQIGVGIAKPLAETMGLVALGALAGTGVGALAGAGYIGAKAVKAAKKAINVGERVGAAAIVYNDTYRTELGATLRMLDEEHPELSEEQKYDYARPAAIINAAIEAIPSLITKGVEGKVFKGMSAIRSASMRAILRSKLPQELSTDPRFLDILTKNIKKKTVKDFVLDAAGTYSVEAATEVIQDSISDSVREVVLNPDLGVLQVASEDLLDFIANPLDPKHAEKWKTAKNVFLGSMLIGESLGGATKAATKIINRAGNRTVGDAISGVRKNQNAAEGLFKWRNTAEVAKASPETVRAHLQNMVDRGDAPSTVYIDKQSAEELMDTDPDVREAFEKLGVLQAIRESETNGGTVEIPLVEYDEVINGDSSGKLYQKVRAMVSFDNNLLSTAEFMRYIQTDANVQGEIAEAQKKADSVYNKTLEIMNTVENMDENTKKMNATIMQLITNRIAGFSIGSPKTAEEVFSKVDILTGQGQPTTSVSEIPSSETQQEISDFEELSDEERDSLPTYDKKGNLKKSTWGKIRGLFTEEQLKKEVPGMFGRPSETVEDLLKHTFDYKTKAARKISMDAIVPTAEHFGLSPQQVYNAFQIARGKEPSVVKPARLEQAIKVTPYNGDTIIVDGKERPTKNSEGKPIAKTEPALRNFWNWFGDSKVVDEDGRPLVVYHGSDVSDIKEFKGKQFFFSQFSDIAGSYGIKYDAEKGEVIEPNLYSVYLKIENPLDIRQLKTFKSVLDNINAEHTEAYKYLERIINNQFNWNDLSYDLQSYYGSRESLENVMWTRLYLDNQKGIIDYAKTNGFDGIFDLEQSNQGGWSYNGLVAFEQNQIKSTQNRGTFSPDTGNIYLQETGKGDEKVVAGWFEKQGDRLVINLTKAQNPTTFAHEAFHLFADSLIESYNAGTLSPYWKAQAEKMFKSAGVKLKDGKAKLTTAQQEKLANQFTTYILEGKVQNKELTPLFAYMKDLFAKVYRLLGLHKYKLDKNITSVFDSIFNSQAEIEAEQRALGMLEFKKPEAADQALYDRYLDFLFKGRAKASTKMALAIKRYEAFKGSSEYISIYAKEYDKASETLRSSLAYRILEIGATVGNDPVATFTALVNEVQDEDLAITVDFVKGVLDNTPPLEEEARRIAEEAVNDYVLEEFGLNKESFASAAIRTADKAKALFAEALLREGKTWAEFESEYSNLLKGVEAQTARMKLSKIRNVDYWNTQEVRLVEQYMYYMATGDMKRAAEVRRSHAALTLIRLKGQEIDKRTQRFKAKFPDKMRFNQKGKAVSATSWELMQSILERYGFKISSKRRDPRPVNIKLDEWIAERESTEYTVVGNVRYFIPDILKGHIGKFSQMDVRTFEIMENVLNAIYSLAKEENSMVREGRKIFFDKLVDETYEHMDKKGIEPFEEKKGWWAKHLGTIAEWTNPEPILEAIFPESVLNALFRPLFTAAAKADNVAKEWSDRWAAIKSKVNLSNDKKTYANGVRLSNFEVADLLLSMGTRHAYDNFLLKHKITDLQAEIVMSEALEEHPELEKFAKDTWALYEKTTDALNKSYERRTNQLFVKKEHRQFDINGIRFEGGYVPENKGYPTIPNDASYNSIMMAMLSNEKMLAREADGEVRSIIDNTDSRLYLFARWAYVAESYNNVCRFMKRDAVRARIGIRADKFIKDWLITYQTPQTDASGLIRPLISATSMAALGFRLSTALLQLSGIFPASKVVGWKNLVRGIRRSMVDADMFGAIKKAADKSEYMKSRYDNPVSSLMGIDSKDLGNVEWLRKNYQKKAMLLISYCDALVSNAVWDAAYIKATEQQGLSHEEAILSADAAVRISQSDSMSLSRSKALQSSWARLVTPYSTYIMGMQSLVRGKIASNEKAYAAAFAMSYIVISTFYEAMLKEVIPGYDEDDDDKYLERVFKTWYNQGVGTFGNTVIPGLNIGGSFASALFSGVEKALRDGDEEMWTKHYAPTVSAFNYLGQVSSIVYNVPSAIAGDEDAQIKAGLSFVGLFSQRGKKALKEWMNE